MSEELILSRIQHGAGMYLSLYQIKTMSYAERIDYVTEKFVAQIRYNTVGRTTQYSHPKDWWQAFRERFFPKWWLRKFPIQYKVIHAYQLFPEITVGKFKAEYMLEGF